MHPAVVWALLGLASGVIAKIILPGKDKGGLITTTLVGIAGSLLGGFLGQHFGITTDSGQLSALSLATAIVGALLLLILFRLLRLLF
jgi:uncharacterized membrane protein YeaQ/YmgE (transglycosylase-associated protein family)